jgi:transcriptional regulator with XRE-family HTH domain
MNTPPRRQFPAATPLRVERLRLGLRLADVARAASVSLTRASEIERDPAAARPAEIDELRRAIEELSGRRHDAEAMR